MNIVNAQTNVPVEIPLGKGFADPTIQFKAGSISVDLPVFIKADGNSYVRFSSTVPGEFTYTSDKEYTINVSEYSGTHPLFRHGPIILSPDKQYLSHSDGTPFFYLADTWWFGGTKRMDFPKTFNKLSEDRREKGFTAVQIVVGIPPEVEAFSDDAQNEGGLPFNKDWSINTRYYDALDKRIDALVKAGIVPVIFGGWGHHIDWMGVKPIKKLWYEIVARYACYPVIFSLCGEADVFLVPPGVNPVIADQAKNKAKELVALLPRPFFNSLVKAKRISSAFLYRNKEKELLKKRIAKWTQVGGYVASIDSFKRILTVHPQRAITAFDLFNNPSWLTLNGVQTGHSLSSIPFMRNAIHKAGKPIINLEPWYEGITDNFYDFYQRVAFWYSVLSGAKGHSYGAHGIWQMADNDNFMGHWGKSEWKKAVAFEGAVQVGKSKNFLIDSVNWKQLQFDPGVSSEKKSKSNLEPIAASTNDQTIIYIPDQDVIPSIHLRKNITKWFITVIDPVNLKKIETIKLAGNRITMPIAPTLKDVLLVTERETV